MHGESERGSDESCNGRYIFRKESITQFSFLDQQIPQNTEIHLHIKATSESAHFLATNTNSHPAAHSGGSDAMCVDILMDQCADLQPTEHPQVIRYINSVHMHAETPTLVQIKYLLTNHLASI